MSGLSSAAGLAAALGSVAELLNKIIDIFRKSPETKERERVEREREKSKEVGEAIKEGKTGDTSKIEDIFNR